MNAKNVMISLQSGYHEGKDIILDRPHWVCVYIYIGFVCLCHVTNPSFKHWVGILLMPKIDRAHKNYHTPEIWKETHIRTEASTPKSPSPDQETKKAKNPEDQAAKDTPNPLSEPENPTQAFSW